ncbi:TetR/AcrR family transcriptional regulator [Niabella beijingensis]|uniref:TetR/AcrR family transcriptional regulator n=1 Tax=Niabella beijingensis TaxID=2872700 RepID=UPI001CBD544C|nr:TetR/AcrR family transcriptional regulator [Niabella beijingensis]MBZ4191197.1 TetR/AcrR family transcriptional regulator [Niabella beijingensis]
MDTREKILQAALALYNQQGIRTITTRHIAAHLNISPGNLHYHFKHTDDIIRSLYGKLAEAFDAELQKTAALETVDMDTIGELSVRSFRLVFRYRFLFLHFVEIAWRIPWIREHYHGLTQRRTREFIRIFRRMIRSGVFRQDLPDKIWPALVKQLFIVADFWLSNNELTERLSEKKAMVAYKKTFYMMFLPFLNP